MIGIVLFMGAQFAAAFALGSRVAKHFAWDSNTAVARLLFIVLPLAVLLGVPPLDALATCFGYACGFWKARCP